MTDRCGGGAILEDCFYSVSDYTNVRCSRLPQILKPSREHAVSSLYARRISVVDMRV